MKGQAVSEKKIPNVSIFRLAEYQCLLEEIIKQGKKETITSKDIARILGYSEEVVRKDLSFVSKEAGKPGSGYNVRNLRDSISRLFGNRKREPLVFIGSLEAWTGMLNYFNPEEYGFKTVAIFSERPEEDGRKCGQIPVKRMEKIADGLEVAAKIAIIATAKEFAAKAFKYAYNAGIRGILNLTPVIIEDIPEDLRVSQILLPCEIKLVSFLSSEESIHPKRSGIIKDAGIKASLKRSRQ